VPAPSFAWLQWVSKLVLQVVPPVMASLISAYLLSTYHFGSKDAPAPAAAVQSQATEITAAQPAPLAASVIEAEHAHALRPVEARRVVDDREPEQIIELPPVAAAMQRIRQARDGGRETPAAPRVITPVAAPPQQVATVVPAVAVAPTENAPQPIVKPQEETRVLGMRVPSAVTNVGQTIVNVGVEQPARLMNAGLNLGRKTIDAIASILPDSGDKSR
jgi:hypothetical protein